MAKQQTFVILHWYGAETYSDAIRLSGKLDENGKKIAEHDFNRVSVKQLKTALRYLKGWRKQAKEQGWTTLFATLTRDDARYAIEATPDGYNSTGIVAQGWMKDLDEAA